MELKNIQAEQSLLGCVLFDSGTGANSEDILTNANIKDFTHGAHQAIFTAMQSLHSKGLNIDLVILFQELNQTSKYSAAGGIEYLTQLTDTVPSNASYKQYLKIIKDLALLRTMASFGEWITKNSKGMEVADLLAETEKHLDTITMKGTSGDLETLCDTTDNELERIRSAHNGEYEPFGVKTGFTEFDKCLWGLRAGHMVVIAGRPGSGKTDFALNAVFYAAANTKRTCALFSLEMSKQEMLRRLLSIGGSFDSTELLNGNILNANEKSLDRIAKLIKQSKLYIDDTTNQTPQQILTKCKKLKRKHGLDLVVIDYLTKMKPPRDLKNTVTETGELARAVKDLARVLDVPVLCLAQPNRQAERTRDGKSQEPLMSDLRGSGEIEQEADVVGFLLTDNAPEQVIKTVYLQLVKNRHGHMKNFQFKFTGNFHKFEETATVEPASHRITQTALPLTR